VNLAYELEVTGYLKLDW